MSLTPIESVQLNSYFSTGNFSGGNWHYFDAIDGLPPLGGFVFVDRVGAFLARMQRESGGFGVPAIAQFDPLFGDNTSATFKVVLDSLAPSYLGVGEWDQFSGIQNLYGGSNTGTSEIWPYDQATLVPTDPGSSLFPFGWRGSDTSIATVGGWDDNAGAFGSDIVWFETWGYALRVARTRHTDGNLYEGLTLVDLATGLGTLIDVPVAFKAVPAALFESFEFQGDTFDLNTVQFVRDDDSQPAAPKGRIFLGSTAFLSVLGNVDDADWRQYMKVIDWNPLGVTALPGNASRTHLRETLMTRLNFFERQPFGTNPNSLGDAIDTPPGAANGQLRSRFHPATRTFVTLNEYNSTAENERGFARTAFSVALAEAQTPTSLSEVETNKTVRWRSRGLGDIGDAVAGATATWSIDRRSTVDEAFDTSSGSETSVFTAQAPIDTGSLVFSYNGTPLTITTDYTVNEATGEITGAGTHTPFNVSGYTASYGHASTGATPSHGTLLQATSQTDELGLAETQVRYADDADLVAQIDKIQASISDG